MRRSAAPPARSMPCAAARSARTPSSTRSRPRRTPSQRYIEEAKAIRGPRKTQRIRSDLVAELERSQRALEMVEHGTSIMVNVRRGPRELEAQTSIKRGYLNLIHAREAFARNALLAAGFEVDAKAQNAGRGSA